MAHEPSQSKVWIGTIDKFLYVTDVTTRSFNRKLEAHTDVIVSIAIFPKFKYSKDFFNSLILEFLKLISLIY